MKLNRFSIKSDTIENFTTHQTAISLTDNVKVCVSEEPLLSQNKRMFIFPIQHHQVWEMYKKHEVMQPLCSA